MNTYLLSLMAAMLIGAGGVTYRSAHPASTVTARSPSGRLDVRARPKDPEVLRRNFDSGHFSRKEAWHYRRVSKGGSGRKGPVR